MNIYYDLSLSVIFGLVSLACLFLLFTWGGAASYADMRHNKRYQVVAWALCGISGGLAGLALNRVTITMFFYELPLWSLFLFGSAVVGGQLALLGSTAMGTDGKHRLRLFGICSTLWLVFCLFWFL